MVIEKWNNNGNNCLGITGIKLDFKWQYLEYWKNNWLIKKSKLKYKDNVCEGREKRKEKKIHGQQHTLFFT